MLTNTDECSTEDLPLALNRLSTHSELQALGVLFALFFVSANPIQADLIINLDFSNFATGAPADGSAILSGATLAEAQGVIETAANYWENAFANSSSSIGWATNVGGTLTQDISVNWEAKGGNTLATGGTNWFLSDGRWGGSASLNWDNDGTSTFFVDSTPAENSEWQRVTERSLDFNGVSMNAERISYDAPAGTARDNTDMLTVAIHEIGHALGFLGTFPAFAASDLDSDNDIDITSGVFNGAQIGINGGHTNFLITSPNGMYPYDPVGGTFNPFDYNPSVMGPSILTGVRKGLTEADIAIVAEFLQFDMSTVNFNPSGGASVPEPSTFGILAICVVAAIWMRRR